MNEQLFNDLYTAAEFFRISKLYEEIKLRYQNSELDCINKYQDMKKRKESPVIANVFCMIPGMFLLLIGPAINNSIFVLLGLFLLVGFPILNTMRCKKVTEKYKKEADDFWYQKGGYLCAENEKNYDRAQKELEKFQNDNGHVLGFLPQKYQNYTATLYMANSVANLRADTLKEAINLYEQQLHQWEMERINQEIAFQNAQIQDRLAGIYDQQVAANQRLRNIEALEFYQVIQHM